MAESMKVVEAPQPAGTVTPAVFNALQRWPTSLEQRSTLLGVVLRVVVIIDTGLPIGHDPLSTRSDIDLRTTDSQVDIEMGGALSDALKNIGEEGLVDVRPRLPGGSEPPVIRIKPR
jgi:hypothetical protein